MAAFATAVQHVTVGPANQNPHLDLEIVLLSRSESGQGNPQRRAGGAGTGGRGFQALSVMQSEMSGDQNANGEESVAPSGMPVPGVPPTIATESVAVSGSNTPSLVGMRFAPAFKIWPAWEAFPALEVEPMGGGFGGRGGGGGGPVVLGRNARLQHQSAARNDLLFGERCRAECGAVFADRPAQHPILRICSSALEGTSAAR